jgi:hypothetical protein
MSASAFAHRTPGHPGSVAVDTQGALARRVLAFAGPGYLVAVGYMDPGNWATGVAAGSAFGTSLLWVIVLSNLMAITLQALAARLGITTGRDRGARGRRVPRYRPPPVPGWNAVPGRRRCFGTMRSIVERRTFRLGVLVLAFAAVSLSLAMTAPVVDLPWWLWLVNGAAVAAGIGLLVHTRVARAVAGVAVAAAGVFMAISLADVPRMLIRLAELDVWMPVALLAIANAVVTTLLSLWFCIRAIQALLGRQWAATLVTARLTGAALAVIATGHLWFAAAAGVGLGLDTAGGVAISLSASGAQAAGFPGWPIWHFVLGILALMMLAGPRRLVARATTLLVVWCACLPALVLIDAPQIGAPIAPFVVLMTLVFTYLAWWLRDEVHRQVHDLPMVPVPPATPS